MWLKKVVKVTRRAGSYHGLGVPSYEKKEAGRSGGLFRTFADAAAPSGNPGVKNKKKKGGEAGIGGRPPAITEEYKVAWKKIAPRFDMHKVPSDFMDDRPGPATTLPNKLTVNFVLPSRAQLEAKEVDMVSVPAATGMLGLLPGHVPTIAQLRPGLLSVHDGPEVTTFFVSSGFAIVHSNSVADILAVEAVPMDKLDIEEARKGLAEYTQKQGSATTDLDKAEAQIAIEVYGNLVATMSAA